MRLAALAMIILVGAAALVAAFVFRGFVIALFTIDQVPSRFRFP